MHVCHSRPFYSAFLTISPRTILYAWRKSLATKVTAHFCDGCGFSPALNKKAPAQLRGGLSPLISGSRALPRLEAVFAVYRLIGGRPERNRRFPSALCAYGRIHLPVGIAISAAAAAAASLLVLTCSPAIRAALRFIGEPFFLIKSLFALAK